MPGEAALTASDAERYFESYADAIEIIGTATPAGADIFSAPSISVKLSALHPRYEVSQYSRVIDELVPRVVELCNEAGEAGIALTLDAEESHRLELSLNVLDAEREVFSARINQISAEFDARIAGYLLARRTGMLTPASLGLSQR